MDNNNKLYNILSYLAPLWLVGLLAAPNEPDVRFHVNQGIVLTIAEVAVGILGSVIPFIGWFIILPIGSIFCCVIGIMGIVHAVKGEQKEMPLIGKIKILK